MGVGCPAAIVALFLLELNSTLYQGLPADLSTIPVENHELVVSKTYSEGSIIDSNFSNLHILYLQEDPAFNPYFGLNNQSRMLYNKVSINLTQSNTGTFLMAVNKQNQTQVESLYCVTYCIGKLSEPTVHETCFDTINSGALYDTLNESLLSQNIYEINISPYIPSAYAILQLALTTGNKSNVSFSIMNCNSRLFFLDTYGMLRSGRNVTEDEMGVHVLKIAVSARMSDVPRLDLALVTVKVSAVNDFHPMFEQPNGYTFSVNEGKEGLSVGFVKAVDFDGGFNGKVAYSFDKHQDTSFFQLNHTTGEIQTTMPLDRETADSHMFTAIATDHGIPNSLSSQVDVSVLVKDVNDNPPVFVQKEYSLFLSRDTQPGLLLRVNATDVDVGQNAEMVYTITDGNDKELFWINSTSGELFLMTPSNVTADDSTVLAVKAQNKVPTNSSLQDSALVRLTFYGNVTTVSRKTDVALVSGVSVGSVLIAAAALVVVVGLFIWKKRRKRAQEQRQKYESYFIKQSGQMPFDYVCDTVAATDRRSPSSLYHEARDSDSRFSLKHTEVELWSPFTPQSPVRSSSSLSCEREPTKEAHIRLDLSDMDSESHVALRLSLSDEQLPKQSSESLESGGSASSPVIVSVFSDFKGSSEHLDLSSTEFDTQSRSQPLKEVSVSSSSSDDSVALYSNDDVPLSIHKTALAGSLSSLLSSDNESSNQAIIHESEAGILSSDQLVREVKSPACVLAGEIMEDSAEKPPSEKMKDSEDQSNKELLTAKKTARLSLPASTTDHSERALPSSSQDESFTSSSKEEVPLSSHKTTLAASSLSLLLRPFQFLRRGSSDTELRHSEPRMLSSDELGRKVNSLPCVVVGEIKEDSPEQTRSQKMTVSEDRSNKELLTATKTARISLPTITIDHSGTVLPRSSSDDSFASSSKEEVPLLSYIAGSFSSLLSMLPQFLTSQSTDKESSSSSDQAIKHESEKRISSSDHLVREVQSPPCVVTHEIMASSSIVDSFASRSSEDVPLSSHQTSLAGSLSSLLLRPPKCFTSDSSDKELRQSSDQVIKDKSKPGMLSSDQLIRKVVSLPCVVAGEIMKDSAEKTRSEETKDSEDPINKEVLTATKTARFSLPVPTTDLSDTAPPSSSQDELFTSSSSEEVSLNSYKAALAGSSSSLLSRSPQCFTTDSSDKELRQSSDQAIKHRMLSSDELRREVKSLPCVVTGEIMEDSAEKTRSEKMKDSDDQSNMELFTATKTARLSLPTITTDHSETVLPSSSSDDSFASSFKESVPLHSYQTFFAGSFSSLLSMVPQFLRSQSSHKVREVQSGEIMENSAEKTRSNKMKDREDKSNKELLTATKTDRLYVPDPTSDHSETALQSSSSDESYTSCSSKDVALNSHKTAFTGSLSSLLSRPPKCFTSDSADKELRQSSDQVIKYKSKSGMLSSDELIRKAISLPCVVVDESIADSAEITISKKVRDSEDESNKELLTATKTDRLSLPDPTTEHSETALPSSSSVDSFASCSSEDVPLRSSKTSLAGSLSSLLSRPPKCFTSDSSDKELRQSSDQVIKYKSKPGMLSYDELIRKAISLPCVVVDESMADSAEITISKKVRDSEDESIKELLTATKTDSLSVPVPTTEHSETALPSSSSVDSFASCSSEDVPLSSRKTSSAGSLSSLLSRPPKCFTSDSSDKELRQSSDQVIKYKSKPGMLSSDQLIRRVMSLPCVVADEIMEDSAEKTRSKKTKDSEDQSNKELLTATKTDSLSVPVPTTDHSETALPSSPQDDSFTSSSNKEVLLGSDNTALSGFSLSLLSSPFQFLRSESKDKKSSHHVIKHKSKPRMSSSDELGREVQSWPCVVADKIMEDFADKMRSEKTKDSEDPSNKEVLTTTKTARRSLSATTTDHSERALPSSSQDESFTSFSNEEFPLSSHKTALAGSSSSLLSRSPQCFTSDSSDKELRQSSDQVIKYKSKPGMLSSDELIRKAISLPCVVVDASIADSAEITISKNVMDSEDESNKELLTATKTDRLYVPDPTSDHSETALLSSSSDESYTSCSSKDVALNSHKTACTASLSSLLSRPPKCFTSDSADKELRQSSDQVIKYKSKPGMLSSDELIRKAISLPCVVVDESIADSAEITISKKVRDSEDESNKELLTATKTDSLSVPVPTTEHSETALPSSSSVDSFASCSSEDVPLSSRKTSLTGSLSSLLSRPPKCFTTDSSDKELRQSSDQVIKYKSKPGMLSSDELIRKAISLPCVVVDESIADSAEITISKKVRDSEDESIKELLTATKTDSLSVPVPTTEHSETALPSSSSVDSFASCSSEDVPLSSRKTSLTGSLSSLLSRPPQCFTSASSVNELRQSSDQTIEHESIETIWSSDELMREVMSPPCVVADEIIEDSAEKTLSEKTKDSEDPSNKETMLPSYSQDESFSSPSNEEIPLSSSNTALSDFSLSLLSSPFQFLRSESKNKESSQSSDQVIKHKSKPKMLSSDELGREVQSPPCVVVGEIMEDSAEETRSEKMRDSEDQNIKELLTATKTVRFSLPITTTDYVETALPSACRDESFTSSSNEDVSLSSHKIALAGSLSSLLSRSPESSEDLATKAVTLSLSATTTDHLETVLPSSSSDDSFSSSCNDDVPISRYETALAGSSSSLVSMPLHLFRSESSDEDSGSSFEDDDFPSLTVFESSQVGVDLDSPLQSPTQRPDSLLSETSSDSLTSYGNFNEDIESFTTCILPRSFRQSSSLQGSSRQDVSPVVSERESRRYLEDVDRACLLQSPTQRPESSLPRSLSDSLILSGNLNEGTGLSSDIESYTTCLVSQSFRRQSKRFQGFESKQSLRHDVSPVVSELESRRYLEDVDRACPLQSPTQRPESSLPQSLSDSLILSGHFNEGIGLSSDIESYTTCLVSQSFRRQSKRFQGFESKQSLRPVSPVVSERESRSSLVDDQLLSPGEGEIRNSIAVSKPENKEPEMEVELSPPSSENGDRRLSTEDAQELGDEELGAVASENL